MEFEIILQSMSCHFPFIQPPTKEPEEIQSIKEFFERFDQQKETKESEDIRFFKAQSWHDSIKDYPVTIKYEVKSNFINKKWMKTIQRVLKHISESAPGVRFVRYKNESSEFYDSESNYKIIYFLSRSEEELSNENIYIQNIWWVFVPEEWDNKNYELL